MAPPPPPQGYHWAAATAFSPLRPWSCFPLLRFRLRFAPPRPRGVAAPVMVADAGPPPTLHLPTEIQFGGGEEEEEEEDEEVDERERLRRMRISQANKGNTPWNKGRKHSPETVQRIRERTRIAMQDPKVKKKLMNLGHAQSEETRIKISEGVRRGWSLRLKKLMVQDGCYVEWLDMIADAARKGFAGGVVLQWNSYRILTEQMRKEWIENHQKRESMPRPRGNRRAPKTPEQRKKIAEAIAAKWLDQEYRERVCSGIANHHGTTAGMKPPQKPQSAMQPGTKREPVKKKTLQPRAVKVQAKHQTTEIVKRKKSVTPYKDPMAGEKLEMITKIRAQRAALEIEKREAIKTARSLIAEAEKAADALEIVAVTSPFAQASLIETRRLVAEARTSLKCVVNDEAPTQNASNDTSEDPAVSELHNCNSESQNGVMASEHKPVNGMDFHFDVSALGEREQPRVSSTIENSMERAYLLPSASTHEDIDKGLSMADFEMSQSILNNQIGAETTGNDPSGTPKDEVSSPVTNTKMRWVCGRLVEVEE